MIDKGFRRIALILGSITVITSIAVGIYLYFNFNAKSRLPLVVPDSATWFLQIRTKSIKEDVSTKLIPASFNEFVDSVKNAPAFKFLPDPGQTGISLMSDIVLFQTKNASFFSVSLSNESRFSSYLDSLKAKGIMHGKVEKSNYNYAQVVGKPWYVIYKLKALVIMVPHNPNIEASQVEPIIEEVFSGKPSKFISNALIQNLYAQDCQLIYWSKNNSKESAVGYYWNRENCKQIYLGAMKESASKNLRFRDVLAVGWINFGGNSQNISSVPNPETHPTIIEDLKNGKEALEVLFFRSLEWYKSEKIPQKK